MKKLKLTKIIFNEQSLLSGEMKKITGGGGGNCCCGCIYANAGGSTHFNNDSANAARGLRSPYC